MSQEQVLVVDDEEVMRDVLGRVLDQAGYEVAFAETGTEGVEAARKGSFAAAIVDVMLPEMGGLEVLEELKKHDPELVVLMITAFASMEMAIDAIKKGAFYFVPEALRQPAAAPHPRERAAAAAARRTRTASCARRCGTRAASWSSSARASDAAGVPARLAGGALALDDPGVGRERHRQGAGGQGDPPELAAARQAVRGGELRARCRTSCSSRTCSAT